MSLSCLLFLEHRLAEGWERKGGKPVQVYPACQYCPFSSLTNWTWNGWWEKAEGIRLGCLTLQWAALIRKGVKRQRDLRSEMMNLIWKYHFGVLQVTPQKSLKNELIKWMSFLHGEGTSKQEFLRGVLRAPGKMLSKLNIDSSIHYLTYTVQCLVMCKVRTCYAWCCIEQGKFKTVLVKTLKL